MGRSIKRKPVSASLRWQILARDGFRCRYCGSQAGEPGVVLHADHVISVADGGTNAADNLAAACQRCNGGKGAKSLAVTPDGSRRIENLEKNTSVLEQNAFLMQMQAEAIEENRRAQANAKQAIVNVIASAYGLKEFRMSARDLDRFVYLSRLHGGELLADWVNQAAFRRVKLHECLRYVHGIIRTIRREQDKPSDNQAAS